jgi:hypothetical protein
MTDGAGFDELYHNIYSFNFIFISKIYKSILYK